MIKFPGISTCQNHVNPFHSLRPATTISPLISLRISSFFASPPIRVTPLPLTGSNPPILASGLKINCARNASSCTRIYLPRDVFVLPLNIFLLASLPRKIGRRRNNETVFKFRFEDRVVYRWIFDFFFPSLFFQNAESLISALSMNRTTSFFSPSNSNIHT